MRVLAVLALWALCGACRGDYLGRLCVSDWLNGKTGPVATLNGDNMTLRMCLDYCNGTSYAGLLGGRQCWCNNDYPTNALCRDPPANSTGICQAAKCAASSGEPCEGDRSLICGDRNLKWYHITATYSLYDGADGKRGVVRSCATTAAQLCSAGTGCTLTCQIPANCSGHIAGTQSYDSATSSICLSAAHDLRYEPGTRGAVRLDRKMEKQEPEPIEGSWRFGLSSRWTDTADSFFFSPPQLWHFPPAQLFAYFHLKDEKGACVVNTSLPDTQLAGRAFNGTLLDMINGTSLSLSNMKAESMPPFCALEPGNGSIPTSDLPITIPSQSSTVSARFLTVTTTRGKDASIVFDLAPAAPSRLVLAKAGRRLALSSLGKATATLIISNAQQEHGGFYVLLAADSGARLATTRLIVTDVESRDPRCSNGGLRREDGVCLCLHPFTGPDCSSQCSSLDMIGPNCAPLCPAKSNCKGVLICDPDPVGCHCAAGWRGPGCDEGCLLGTYGPSCANTGCHCAVASACNQYTGECAGGKCAVGFFNPHCNVEGPSLAHAPACVDPRSFNSLTVAWGKWDPTAGDFGSVGPDSYLLERFSDSEKSWNMLANVTANPALNEYTFSLSGLAPRSKPQFRVTTIYRGVRMKPSPVATCPVLCGAATRPGTIVNVTLGANSTALLRWTLPAKESWNCDRLDAFLRVACVQDGCDGGAFNKLIALPPKASSYSVAILPFANCTFRLGVATSANNSHTLNSQDFHLQTRDGVPGQVRGLRAFNTATGLLLIWSPPDANGDLKAYYISVTPSTKMNQEEPSSYGMLAGVWRRLFGDGSAPQLITLSPSNTSYLFKPPSTEKKSYSVGVSAGNADYNGSAAVLSADFSPLVESVAADSHYWFWVVIVILAVCLGLSLLAVLACAFALCQRRKGSVAEGKGYVAKRPDLGLSEPRYAPNPRGLARNYETRPAQSSHSPSLRQHEDIEVHM